MATSNPPEPLSFIAGSNVKRNRFAIRAAGNIVNGVLTAGGAIGGVIADTDGGAIGTTIAAGNDAPMWECGDGGVSRVECGAAITDANQEGMSDALGRVVVFAAGAGALAVGRFANGNTAAAAGSTVGFKLYPVTAQHV